MEPHWKARLGVGLLAVAFLASLTAQEWHGIFHPDVDAAEINRQNQTAHAQTQRWLAEREAGLDAQVTQTRVASAALPKRP